MQASQNLLEEVVSAQLHLNPRAINPAAGTDILDICYLATGAKILLGSTDNMVSYLLYIAVFAWHCWTERSVPLPLFLCVVSSSGKSVYLPNIDEAFHLLAASS